MPCRNPAFTPGSTSRETSKPVAIIHASTQVTGQHVPATATTSYRSRTLCPPRKEIFQNLHRAHAQGTSGLSGVSVSSTTARRWFRGLSSVAPVRARRVRELKAHCTERDLFSRYHYSGGMFSEDAGTAKFRPPAPARNMDIQSKQHEGAPTIVLPSFSRKFPRVSTDSMAGKNTSRGIPAVRLYSHSATAKLNNDDDARAHI